MSSTENTPESEDQTHVVPKPRSKLGTAAWVGLGAALGVGGTLAVQNRAAIWNTVTSIIPTSSANPGSPKSTRKSGGDYGKGGIVDEVWNRPDLVKMGPDDFEYNGEWIKTENYHNIDMFATPKNVFRLGQTEESPIEMRIRIEERLTGESVDKEKVLNYFNNLSNLVGKLMQKEAGALDIKVANTQVSDKRFFELAAQAFRMGNAVYKSEERLLSSFDPMTHKRAYVHFDCNMLAEGFKHMAQNYGRKLNLQIGPGHMFATFPGHDLEATAFRDVKHSTDGSGKQVEWKVTEHMDSPKDILITPADWHFEQSCKRGNLVVSEHNRKILLCMLELLLDCF